MPTTADHYHIRITECPSCHLRQRRSRLGHCIRDGCRAKLPLPSDCDEILDPARIIRRPPAGSFVFLPAAAAVPPATTPAPPAVPRLVAAVAERVSLAQAETAAAMSRADSFASRWLTILQREGRRAARRLFATDPEAQLLPADDPRRASVRRRQSRDRSRSRERSRAASAGS